MENTIMASNHINRREFLGKASLGLAVSGLGFPALKAAQNEEKEKQKIIYRTLGRTGLKLPVVSMGVMNSNNPHLVKTALELGIKHLDTAHAYQRGNNETMIGQVLKETGKRKEVAVATKMRFARDREKHIFQLKEDGWQPGASEENLMKQLDVSLERLQTDYIDILYLHSCYSPAMAVYEPLMNALVKAKKMGKARFIGISTHRDEANVIKAAVDTGVYDVVLTAYNFVQDHKKEVKNAIQYAAEKGIGIVAMKTQGGRRLQQDGSVEVNHQAALKWVLNDKNVGTAIPGATSFDQLESNISIMNDLTLTDEEKRDLKLSSLLPGKLYCQQCGKCIPSCPQRVEVPVLMRAYMYSQGYDNQQQARETAAELSTERGLQACQGCSSCTAQCIRGIQIGERIQSLMELV
jgi:predicted aldo/keto reductase-like oxidoreductase